MGGRGFLLLWPWALIECDECGTGNWQHLRSAELSCAMAVLIYLWLLSVTQLWSTASVPVLSARVTPRAPWTFSRYSFRWASRTVAPWRAQCTWSAGVAPDVAPDAVPDVVPDDIAANLLDFACLRGPIAMWWRFWRPLGNSRDSDEDLGIAMHWSLSIRRWAGVRVSVAPARPGTPLPTCAFATLWLGAEWPRIMWFGADRFGLKPEAAVLWRKKSYDWYEMEKPAQYRHNYAHTYRRSFKHTHRHL